MSKVSFSKQGRSFHSKATPTLWGQRKGAYLHLSNAHSMHGSTCHNNYIIMHRKFYTPLSLCNLLLFFDTMKLKK